MTDRCHCGRFIKEDELHCRRCGEKYLILMPVLEALVESGELEDIPRKGMSDRSYQGLLSEQYRMKNGEIAPEFLDRVFHEVDGYYDLSQRERSWLG